MAKDVDRIKLLLSRHCDVTAANDAGSTALHLASDPEIVSMLLEAVSDDELSNTVNAMDANGECNDQVSCTYLVLYKLRRSYLITFWMMFCML